MNYISATMPLAHFGYVALLANDQRSLVRMAFGKSPQEATEVVMAQHGLDQPPVENHAALASHMLQISAWLAGAQTDMTLPFIIEYGTPLQRAVWHALQHIPRGMSISYTSLATAIGQPAAVRAVASACGANPLPLLIPCHRVLRKSGDLGGFAWGLNVKEWLLTQEGVAYSTRSSAAA